MFNQSINQYMVDIINVGWIWDTGQIWCISGTQSGLDWSRLLLCTLDTEEFSEHLGSRSYYFQFQMRKLRLRAAPCWRPHSWYWRQRDVSDPHGRSVLTPGPCIERSSHPQRWSGHQISLRLCPFISVTYTLWESCWLPIHFAQISMKAYEYVIDHTQSQDNYSFCNWNWLLLDIFQQHDTEHDS